MKEKNTKELNEVLGKTHLSDFEKYCAENKESVSDNSEAFSIYVKNLLQEKKLTQQYVFLQADIPERYGYKLLSGEKRTRQRDVILRICYAAKFSLAETQRANPLFILRAFERGADGVILCGCHPGDCHYTTGNYYARRRMTLLFSMLDYLGIEKERARVEWVSAAEGARFASVMNDFVDTITKLGENRKLRDLRCEK